MLLNNDIAQSILNRIVLLLNILRKHIPISAHLTVLPYGRIVNNNKISILKLLSFSRSYHSSSNLQQALTPPKASKAASLMGVGIDSQIPRSEKDLNLL